MQDLGCELPGNEAGDVVLPLAHLDGHQTLHQEEPANRNQNEQTYQQEPGEYANGEPPLAYL
jgi:hypothetical protein